MLTSKTIKQISDIFNGDIDKELFKYKSGPSLIEFFNFNFDYSDSYGQGFPSRWTYTADKILELIETGKIDDFFNLILNKQYLMREKSINQVEAVELGEKIYKKINEYLTIDEYKLVKKGGEYKLVIENEDMEFVKEGGFAKIYIQKSTGKIIKQLHDEFFTDISIKSRFKREFEITKSLIKIPGVIEVYDFDSNNYSYTMELAEKNLLEEVINNKYTWEDQKRIIMKIIKIMGLIHEVGVVHRDLSPQNILLIQGELKIADFGLGKDLSLIHSHETVDTNNYGKFYYCAPEQLSALKKGDKRSDVFSLGKLINFIMNRNPLLDEHNLQNIVDKATMLNPDERYQNAVELKKGLEQAIEYIESENREIEVKRKIKQGIFDEDVNSYIYTLNGLKLCESLLKIPNFYSVLLIFIKNNNKDRRLKTLSLIENSYTDYCGTNWNDYDVFKNFTTLVIESSDFSYFEKEKAAKILYSLAYEKNRFNARNAIERLVKNGIEPTIEKILVDSV